MPYKGIGGSGKGTNAKNVKAQQLLNDLAKRLKAIQAKYSSYKQDSICGTWECLADMLTKGGIANFRKKNPTAFDVGRCKSEWAEKIGRQMNLRENTSPSFQKFLQELDRRRELCF